MHLPDSLSRQPFLDYLWFFLAKLSQFSDGFPKMIRLTIDILELIHFGNTLDNKQERVSKS